MKLRTGFVSNSSSSSFCIFGAELSGKADDLIKKFELDENIDNYELAEVLAEKTGLSCETGPDSECIYIGKEWCSIKDDETGAEFKKSIKDAIVKVIEVDVDCDTFSEAWYAG